MTQETTTENEAQLETAAESTGPAQLREALDREKARRQELENKLTDQTFDALGLKRGEGIGKAIDKLFDGDKTDREAVEAYARSEFNWTPSTEDTPPAATPQQELVQEGQQRVDEATASGSPITGGSLERQIQQAAEEGRHADSIALKLQLAQQQGIIGTGS